MFGASATTSTLRFIRIVFLIAPVMAASATVTIGQTIIRGNVLMSDGKPIAGVGIYGSNGRRCCSSPLDTTETNQNGEFHLDRPEVILHLRKEGFRPLTLLVERRSQIQAVMSLADDNFVLTACRRPDHGEQLVGWGQFGLQFLVPPHGVKLRVGEPDIDNLEDVLRPRKGKSYLEFWFGSSTVSLDPEDERFLSSTDFAQRNIVAPDGVVLGHDSWGHLRNGNRWRETAVVGSGGAIYRDASPEDATLFDQLIASMCSVTPPSKQGHPKRKNPSAQ
jgi:hypothetical protein